VSFDKHRVVALSDVPVLAEGVRDERRRYISCCTPGLPPGFGIPGGWLPGFSPRLRDSVVKRLECCAMAIVRLKIDVSGTHGTEAWTKLQQFDQIQSAAFGPRFGFSRPCKHPPSEPHAKGEWIGAEIHLQTPLLAQYAVAHYLEQERVLDADVVE